MALLSKEEIKLIEQIEGQNIGHGLKKDREFVLEEKGREGLERVEKEMEKLGYLLKYKEIEKYKWYPSRLEILFLLLSQRIFGWDDEKIRAWGRWEAKTHFLTRLMIKYFVSVEILAKNVDKYWRKYYDTSELKVDKLDKEKRYLILVLRNYRSLPVHQRFLEGYFYQIGAFVLPPKNLKVKLLETKEKEGTYIFKASW